MIGAELTNGRVTAARIAHAIKVTVTSSARPRTARSAALWLIPVLIAGIAPYHRAFTDPVPFVADGHAYAAIGLAVDAEYCGKPGMLSAYNIGMALTDDPRLMRQPIPNVMRFLAGSRQAYCQTAQYPFLNNENSTMLLMRGAFHLFPGMSADELGLCLSLVRLSMVAGFAFALIRLGAGIPFTTAVVLTACDVLGDLQSFQYSIYSFFIPLILASASCYAVLTSAGRGRGVAWTLTTSVFVGFLSAFAVNMRSSHLPVYLALFVVYLIAVRDELRWRPRQWIFATMMPVMFIVGYAAFGRVFISPITPDRSGTFQNYSYHVIAHPLVLSLGVLPSRLARREGITWNDTVGMDLATRMIPDAVYLGPGYEKALFLYYARLWLLYPDEMRDLYRRKLQLAGTGMFAGPGSVTANQRVAQWVTRVIRIDEGSQLLGIYVAALAAFGLVFVWTRHPLALFMVFLSVPAVLLFLESALIMSRFYLQYHGYLLLYTALLLLVAAQLIVDAVAWTADAFAARVHRAGAREEPIVSGPPVSATDASRGHSH